MNDLSQLIIALGAGVGGERVQNTTRDGEPREQRDPRRHPAHRLRRLRCRHHLPPRAPPIPPLSPPSLLLSYLVDNCLYYLYCTLYSIT